jgi:hypothetical protein
MGWWLLWDLEHTACNVVQAWAGGCNVEHSMAPIPSRVRIPPPKKTCGCHQKMLTFRKQRGKIIPTRSTFKMTVKPTVYNLYETNVLLYICDQMKIAREALMWSAITIEWSLKEKGRRYYPVSLFDDGIVLTWCCRRRKKHSPHFRSSGGS